MPVTWNSLLDKVWGFVWGIIELSTAMVISAVISLFELTTRYIADNTVTFVLLFIMGIFALLTTRQGSYYSRRIYYYGKSRIK